MKSKKAKEYLDRKSPTQIHPVSGGVTYMLLNRFDAEKAIDLAEQETEKRMRQKAIEAFDDMWFSGFEPDYEYHRMNFIKKLNEE